MRFESLSPVFFSESMEAARLGVKMGSVQSQVGARNAQRFDTAGLRFLFVHLW